MIGYLADVDELAPVVDDAGQEPVLLELGHPVYGLLRLEMELGREVLQQHHLGLLDVVDKLQQPEISINYQQGSRQVVPSVQFFASRLVL